MPGPAGEMTERSQDQKKMALPAVNYGVLPREQRRNLFGVDCIEQLEWRNWQPGTEYVKNLVLKNVSTNTVKIRYKQTHSKAFSMDFPEPIKLRPGMSHSLKVVFRPLKMQQYNDQVEIFCGEASFLVPVLAYTPATHIEVPAVLNFGFVPTKETVKLPLTVRNTGDVKVGLTWKLEPPYGIEPASGSLQPGSSATFMVSFTPTEACTYDASAYCELDSGSGASVKITGIGKFPYLSNEQSSVDFGNVIVGKVVERVLRFGNHSVVDANFSVVHAEGPEDGVFKVTPAKGTLGPDEYSVLQLSYTPKHTGTFSSENFILSTAGGNKLTLNMRGNAIGPTVTFSTHSFNFGNVQLGQSASRVLYIQNHSDVAICYGFQLDPLDVFNISKPSGIIAPQTTGHVTLTFTSSRPANYWKRVSCIIKDAADPLSLDLLATCYDEKSRPPPLTAKHIVNYVTRIANGGSPVDADLNASSLPPTPAGPGYSRGGVMDGPLESTLAGGVTDATAGPLMGPDSWDLLFEGQDPAKAVTVDMQSLDFGTCSRLSTAEYKSVVVTNNTSAKLTAFFTVPGWQDPMGGEARPVFQAFPESADIKPHTQSTFRVAFRPPKDATYYSQTLHLVAAVKSMRNFRLVADHQVVPPWTLPISVSGNTFLHCNPEFSPKVELTHSSMSFPPCRLGERVCQTSMIVNYGDTPVHFHFESATLSEGFEIKPMQGVVPPKGHTLLAVRFTPSAAKPSSSCKAICVFNNVSSNGVELLLRGAAHTPRLTFDISGSLFFRPTCVGASSQRAMTMHNPSRVPVAFRWQLPRRLEGVVSVSPVAGLLRGNESTQVTWTFVPAKQKQYESKVACLMMPPSASGDNNLMLLEAHDAGYSSDPCMDASPRSIARSVPPSAPSGGSSSSLVYVHLVGEGTQGALALDPPSLELGTVAVGIPVKKTLTLLNQSDGVLRYSLDVAPVEGEGGDGSPEPGATPVEFPSASLAVAGGAGPPAPGSPGALVSSAGPVECWVDEPEGALPARASKTVTVTLFPRFRKNYRLQVRCRTTTVAPLNVPAADGAPGGGRSRPPSGSSALKPLAGPGKLPALGAGPAASAAEENQAPPTLCPVLATTAYPSVLISDVFCEGLPKQVLWDLLGVKDLNRELRSNVTALELELNRMEDKGALTTDSAIRALAPFVLQFGTQALGGAPVVVHVELTNNTALPAHWELHSYDDPDLDMENWVEPGRPRNEEEKARDFITEHKIFEIRPRHAKLEPGAKCSVTLVYKPMFEGFHDLPIFFHCQDGKRVRLQLQGTTVQPPVQRLTLLPEYRTFTFDAVPIGEVQPPFQTYMLRNGGPSPLTFRLDLSPLHTLKSQNHGYEIVKLSSESMGEIQPGGSYPLNWIFNPLEATVYSVDIPLTLGDGSSEVLTLTGRGYHPDRPDEPAAPPGECGRHWARWDGFSGEPSAGLSTRLALVSHDVLSLGTSMIRGITRRVLVVINKSRLPLAYSWDLGSFRGAQPQLSVVQGNLSISPAEGYLAPGERALCKVTLEAGLQPQLFESEIRCHISVDEELLMELAAEAQMQAASAAQAAEDGESVVEEVIVESPSKHSTYIKGSRLRSRLPVHQYMTTAIRGRMDRLDAQYMTTLSTMTQRQLDATRSPDMPPPQVITVTLSGRILTPAQITLGTYVPPCEREAAAELLEGTAWIPPLVRPFWLPEPTALAGATSVPGGGSGPRASSSGATKAQGAEQGMGQGEDVDPPGSRTPPRASSQGEPRAPQDPPLAAGSKPPSKPGSPREEAAQQQQPPQQAAPPPKPPSPQQKPPSSAGSGQGEEASGGPTIKAWKLLERPPRPPQPPQVPITQEGIAWGAAELVLQDVLADLLQDPEVLASFHTLEDDTVPLYVESVRAGGPPEIYAIKHQRALAGLPLDGSAPPPPPEVLAAMQAANPGVVLSSSAEQQQGSGEPVAVDAEAAAAAAAAAADAAEDARLREVMLNKRFQLFAEYVMESAVLALVQESAVGEWGENGADDGEGR